MCDCMLVCSLTSDFLSEILNNKQSLHLGGTLFCKHIKFLWYWMKASQDFSLLRCCRHIMIQKLKGSVCLACGVGSLPLAVTPVSCRWWHPLPLCRKWANVDAIRQTQLGLCWENSSIHTLHGDGMLRPPANIEAYPLNETLWVV